MFYISGPLVAEGFTGFVTFYKCQKLAQNDTVCTGGHEQVFDQ